MNSREQIDRAALQQIPEQLVEAAEQVVKDLRIDARSAEEMGKSQASKAIQVAQAADSLRVFINWVRYQAGRERSADFWSRETGSDQKLVERLAGEFREFEQKLAGRIADESRRGPTLMAAVVLFLGYFRRALVGYQYLTKVTV